MSLEKVGTIVINNPGGLKQILNFYINNHYCTKTLKSFVLSYNFIHEKLCQNKILKNVNIYLTDSG